MYKGQIISLIELKLLYYKVSKTLQIAKNFPLTSVLLIKITLVCQCLYINVHKLMFANYELVYISHVNFKFH